MCRTGAFLRDRVVYQSTGIPALRHRLTSWNRFAAGLLRKELHISCLANDVNSEGGVSVKFVTENAWEQSEKQTYPASVNQLFQGKKSQVFQVPDKDSVHLLIGLGKEAKVTATTLQSATSQVIKSLKSLRTSSVPVGMHLPVLPSLNHVQSATLIVQSLMSGLYQFDRYLTTKKKKDQEKIKEIRFIVPADKTEQVRQQAERAVKLAECTWLSRDLANERADVCTPEYYENEARKIAEQYGFSISVLTGNELAEKGLNLLFNVGKSAKVAPRLVILRNEGDKSKPNLTLVGKGVTFDSGGLNLKSTGNIESMYMDNAGAASVLATMAAIGKFEELRHGTNVVAALALAENAIGPEAYKPSAIITSYKGLSVEIGNTDAEGRLCLADAMTYVQRHYGPCHTLIDVATLTGACIVALGDKVAGLFSNNNSLASKLQQIGDATQEPCWHMPILQSHLSALKASQADLKSATQNRKAGACVAAAFLSHFVEPHVQWAHLDVAGPAMHSSGATGFGTHLLSEFVHEFYGLPRVFADLPSSVSEAGPNDPDRSDVDVEEEEEQ